MIPLFPARTCLAAALAFTLIACGDPEVAEAQPSAIKQPGAANAIKTYRLASRWAEAEIRIEEAFVGNRFDEDASRGRIRQINFRLDLDTMAPGAQSPDENDRVVVVQPIMTSPDWITKEADPSFLSHFNLYSPTGTPRYGLEYRPSDQGFLLVGADRPRPVMIECYLRPANLPTRCQLWERQEQAFSLSIYFNGSRLSEWPLLLRQVRAFVSPRISVRPNQEPTDE